MDWDAALAVLDQKAAEVFDTVTFTVRPMKDGLSANHGRVADPARAAFDFLGSLDIGPPAMARGALVADPAVRAQSVDFEAVATAHSAGWPYIPSRRDIFEADGTRWSIADVDRDGTARRVFYLTKAH